MRKQLDAFQTLWRQATPLRRALIVAVPVIVLALVATGVSVAAMHGGGGSSAQAHAAPSRTATNAATETVTTTPVPTETPASAGLQTGGSAGQAPTGNYARVQPHSGTGPGAAQSSGMSLSIPAISVNASVYSRSVGTNGVMGNPVGAWDVIWYDFSNFSGLGGYPGDPGANAVFAGHVDYIHVGPAVFWSLRDLTPGARVTVNTPKGPITYAVQWTQWAAPDADFSQFVAKTGQDSITLVTCIGDFAAGHYSNRFIVRGVRV